MVRALGYSNAPFKPFKPGRLCRGRERWIEVWDPEADEEQVEVQRLVLSGAAFSDLSAADALRGLPHSGLDGADLIRRLFPKDALLAFMEDGHPADIPDDALGVELYDGYRAGGRSDAAMVRWYKRVSDIDEIRTLLDDGEDRLRGFAVVKPGTDDAALFESLFPLVGMATLDSPPARFQPGALPAVVPLVKALILVHRDKHGISLGIYSEDPIDATDELVKACGTADALLVPFAIPPMLARWDRALAELRSGWRGEAPFPVPEPSGGYSWENRRGRRRRSRKGDLDEGGDDESPELDDVEEVDGDEPEEADDADDADEGDDADDLDEPDEPDDGDEPGGDDE
ncbi:MAG: hypothetical protein H6737_31690 [Alphaproteobacteria bacterium]|nr:hypothetical protein [Alphaproteobacteria bacterium]